MSYKEILSRQCDGVSPTPSRKSLKSDNLPVVHSTKDSSRTSSASKSSRGSKRHSSTDSSKSSSPKLKASSNHSTCKEVENSLSATSPWARTGINLCGNLSLSSPPDGLDVLSGDEDKVEDLIDQLELSETIKQADEQLRKLMNSSQTDMQSSFQSGRLPDTPSDPDSLSEKDSLKILESATTPSGRPNTSSSKSSRASSPFRSLQSQVRPKSASQMEGQGQQPPVSPNLSFTYNEQLEDETFPTDSNMIENVISTLINELEISRKSSKANSRNNLTNERSRDKVNVHKKEECETKRMTLNEDLTRKSITAKPKTNSRLTTPTRQPPKRSTSISSSRSNGGPESCKFATNKSSIQSSCPPLPPNKSAIRAKLVPSNISACGKSVIEQQFIVKKKRLNTLKKELTDKQKTILDLYGSMLAMKAKISKTSGKEVDLESIRLVTYGNEDIADLVGAADIKAAAALGSGASGNRLKSDSESPFINSVEENIKKIPTTILQICRSAVEQNTSFINWFHNSKENIQVSNEDILNQFKAHETQSYTLGAVLDNVEKSQEIEVDNLLATYRSAITDRELLSKDKNDLMNKIQILQDDNAKARSELRESEKKCKDFSMQLEQEISKGKEKKNQLEMTIKSIRKKLTDSENKLNQQDCKVNQLTSNVKTLENQIKVKDANYEMRVKELQKKCNTQNMFSEGAEKARVTMELRLHEISETSAAEKKEMQNIIDSLEAKLTDMANELHREMTQRQNLDDLINEFNEKFLEINNILTDKQKILDDTQDKLIKTEKDFVETLKKLDEAEKQLAESCEAQNQEQPNEENIRTPREMELWTELQAMNVSLKAQMQELIELREEKCRFVRMMTEQGQLNNNDVGKEMVLKEERIATLKNQIEQLEQELADSNQKNTRYQRKIHHLETRGGKTESGHTDYDHDTDLQEEDWKVRYDDLAKELKRKTNDLECKDRAMREQSNVLKVRDELILLLKDREMDTKKNIEKMKDDYDDKIIMVQKEIQAKAEELQNLFSTLELKQIQVARLEKIVKSLEEQQSRSQAQRTRYEEKIASLESELADFKAKHNPRYTGDSNRGPRLGSNQNYITINSAMHLTELNTPYKNLKEKICASKKPSRFNRLRKVRSKIDNKLLEKSISKQQLTNFISKANILKQQAWIEEACDNYYDPILDTEPCNIHSTNTNVTVESNYEFSSKSNSSRQVLGEYFYEDYDNDSNFCERIPQTKKLQEYVIDNAKTSLQNYSIPFQTPSNIRPHEESNFTYYGNYESSSVPQVGRPKTAIASPKSEIEQAHQSHEDFIKYTRYIKKEHLKQKASARQVAEATNQVEFYAAIARNHAAQAAKKIKAKYENRHKVQTDTGVVKQHQISKPNPRVSLQNTDFFEESIDENKTAFSDDSTETVIEMRPTYRNMTIEIHPLNSKEMLVPSMSNDSDYYLLTANRNGDFTAENIVPIINSDSICVNNVLNVKRDNNNLYKCEFRSSSLTTTPNDDNSSQRGVFTKRNISGDKVRKRNKNNSLTNITSMSRPIKYDTPGSAQSQDMVFAQCNNYSDDNHFRKYSVY